MAERRRRLKSRDIQGLKYFRKLPPLLERLHQVGCERDGAAYRQLTMDQYCMLLLLWLFSPLVDSLRGLQQASELDKVRKRFGVGRFSLGSLSESVRIFDPEPLREIAAELGHEVSGASAGRFSAVGQELTAVDGSVLDTVVRVAHLSWLPKAKGKSLSAYRLHTHFEVLRGIPTIIDVTPAKPKGEHDERAVFEKYIEPDRCYVTDRGYAKFTLFNAIVAAGSSCVCITLLLCIIMSLSSFALLETWTSLGLWLPGEMCGYVSSTHEGPGYRGKRKEMGTPYDR